MAEPVLLPAVTPHELAEWMQTKPGLVILDVREPYEVSRAHIKDERVVYLPLSRLASASQPELPGEITNREATIVVVCHLGERSAQVTRWLQQMGWKQVYNLTGGIDSYAVEIDPSTGLY